MSNKHDYDPAQPWTLEKLEYLQKYLVAYSNILHKQEWCKEVAYIDAFSGSTYLEDDTGAYLHGSPMRALETKPHFDQLIFIDLNQERVNRLENLRAEHQERRIKVYQGDCNKVLVKEVVPLYPYRSYKRGLVFLDPYGLSVLWTTIEALAKTKTFDLFIHFPVGAAQRNLKSQKVSLIIGDNKWRDCVYSQDQHPLIPGLQPRRVNGVHDALISYYVKKLKGLFKHVSKPRIMRNRGNAPLYALILVSHTDIAVQRMNSIFEAHDKLKK